jgi:large subunit ribosomal protein L18
MSHERRVGRQRQRRAFRVRNRLKRDALRPRLCVFRSHGNCYPQIIDDNQGRTIVAVSTLDKEMKGEVKYGGNKVAAAAVGKAIAAKAIEAGIKEVVFDRREYKYHGRVAALADAAREAGLVF